MKPLIQQMLIIINLKESFVEGVGISPTYIFEIVVKLIELLRP
jgi:hypothetical protein